AAVSAHGRRGSRADQVARAVQGIRRLRLVRRARHIPPRRRRRRPEGLGRRGRGRAPRRSARRRHRTVSVDAVRCPYEAFARHALDGALGMMDENIVWHQAQGLPHGGVYHGLAEVRTNVFDPIDDSWWLDFKADPEEVIGVGEDVVVLGRYTATGKETGR